MIKNPEKIKRQKDLIGKMWYCSYPNCNHKEKITKDGIYHVGNKPFHFFRLSLKDLFNVIKFDREFEKSEMKYLFSKLINKKTNGTNL